MLRSYVHDVWRDQTVRERLSWYYDVLQDLRPAKFLICKQIACKQDPRLMTEAQLWQEHDRLCQEFLKELSEFRSLRESNVSLKRFEKPEFTFLDLKVELLKRILRKCIFCEWRCKIDRYEGKRRGACHLDNTARVSTFFRHFGEEPPLVDLHGSGTIFFTSCTFRCAFCFHPATQVLTQSGPTRISDIYARGNGVTATEQDNLTRPSSVFTIDHHGRYVKVRKAFRHPYSGKMIVVRPYFLPSLTVTPYHEIYATPAPRVLPLAKVKASDLRKGWFLAIPKFDFGRLSGVINVPEVLGNRTSLYRKSTKITPIMAQAILNLRSEGATSNRIAQHVGLAPSYVRKISPRLAREGITDRLFWGQNVLLNDRGHAHFKLEKTPYIHSRVRVDERLASLFGYYCAEGFVGKGADRPSSYRLTFSFGKHELHLAQKVRKLIASVFSVRSQLVQRASTITVECGKSSLALLFAELSGFHSHEKRVPAPIFEAKRRIVRAFLQAYVEGDGSITQNMISSNTVSLRLAHGLCWLFLRLGVLPRFYVWRPSSRSKIGSRVIRQSVMYYVKASLDDYQKKVLNRNVRKLKRRYKLYEEDDNYFYVLIRKVSYVHYSGPVFNLEVAPDSHSYLANFFAAGNCQNWDISQHPDAGAPVSPGNLSLIIKSLRSEGAANINLVGGEPTPNLHVIMEALNLTSVNVPVLWNSNMYLTPEAMQILADVVDIWLPDFKWGNDGCAVKYSRIIRYFEVVSRNHAMAQKNGDMIIRHLVMPDHLECCTKPVLDWIARNCPRALVNVMSQYRPEYLALREPEKYHEIARRTSVQEIREARDYARKLGLIWEPVS